VCGLHDVCGPEEIMWTLASILEPTGEVSAVSLSRCV
jgi:hypothetical protein